MFITPHFILQELIVSQVAAREGLDNTPGPDVLSNLTLLCHTLEAVRELFGLPVLINSGYRSEAVNRRVGGTPNSAHRWGLAADFQVVGVTPADLARCIAESDVVFDQLILEYDRWVHLGISLDEPRRQVLTVRRGTGYLPGIR